jgi:hypothetical protein
MDRICQLIFNIVRRKTDITLNLKYLKIFFFGSTVIFFNL